MTQYRADERRWPSVKPGAFSYPLLNHLRHLGGYLRHLRIHLRTHLRHLRTHLRHLRTHLRINVV